MSARDLPDLNLVVTEMELQFDRLIEQRAHDRKVIATLLATLKQIEAEMSEGIDPLFGETKKQIRWAIALAENR